MSTIEVPQNMPKPVSPVQAIKARCFYCSGSADGVKSCVARQCHLYAYLPRDIAQDDESQPTDSKGGVLKIRGLSLRGRRWKGCKTDFLKAIRRHCLDCCSGSSAIVEDCSEPSCPLYAYRFGVRPATRVKRVTKKRVHNSPQAA